MVDIEIRNIEVEPDSVEIAHVINKSPYIGENGNWFVFDSVTKGFIDTGIVAKGEEGVSPVAKVTKSDGVTTVTITDKSGTTTANILDGKTPVKGVDYWTTADKEEIVTEVLDEIPPYEEEITEIHGEIASIQQELSDKMEFYKLDTQVNGTIVTFYHDGVQLDYNAIVDKYFDDKYFVYAECLNLTFIPCFPPTETDQAIEFISTYIYGGEVMVDRLIINSNNEGKFEEKYIAEKSEVDTLTQTVNTKADQTELNDVKESLSELSDAVFKKAEKKLEWVSGFVNVGNFATSTKDKVLKPVKLFEGETIKVSTKGDGAYFFNVISRVPAADINIAKGASGGTKLAVLSKNSLTEYIYTATEDIFVTVCVLDDQSSVVEFENVKDINRIDVLENDVNDLSVANTGVLRNKSIMYFGDSLTSANGVIGFAEIIADNYRMPYRRFITDRADGNDQDVPVNYKCVTNYAKDGTMNRVISSRHDSVLERVKYHISTETDVDYVFIECCVNDMASSNQNKGSISDSYTAEYDTNTSIGAIEETIRYLTTLGKNIKVGCVIPWLIAWQVDGWFDDYIPVFKKWGVPVFDMRVCSGFNLRRCGNHRLLYTLSSDSYEIYSGTKTYNLDDKVKYQGALYKCLANGVVGVLPTDTTKWMSVSSESADGTHLNNLGHQIVSGKIQKFIESL